MKNLFTAILLTVLAAVPVAALAGTRIVTLSVSGMT